MHPKGEKIFWACGKDNITKEKKEQKSIGTHGFDYNFFEYEEIGCVIQVIYVYPYLKHIVEFWTGYCKEHLGKKYEWV